MILVKEVEVKLGGKYKHYQDKGYKLPWKLSKSKFQNKGKLIIPIGATLIVKISDLPIRSSVLLPAQCEICKEIRHVTMNHLRAHKNGNFAKDGTTFCNTCHKKSLTGAKSPSYVHGSQGFSSYKSRAYRKKVEFSLSVEEFIDLTTQNCHYCNGSYSNVRDENMRCGVDRKDSAQGYTLSNCLPCCKVCNFAKKDTSYEEFKTWIEKVSANFLKK